MKNVTVHNKKHLLPILLPVLIPLLPLLLAGCASYTPLPLPARPALLARVPHLHVDPAQLPLPALQAHRFDPADGLDITEVATLAVINNPDLKLARDDARVSHAQAFAAGLLPDPQLSLARDIPAGGADLTSAFNIGLGYDLNALVTYGAGKAAAHGKARQADLNLLWQEWQVIGQARTLFVQLVEQGKQMAVLEQSRALAQQRYTRIRRAAAQGNAILDAVTTNLAMLQDVQRQINALARTIGKNRLDLDALLGLSPRARLDLVGSLALPAPVPQQVRALLSERLQQRPDLLALRAGYQSQDALYRRAILAQFPSLNVGFTRARDTSGIYTHGFSVTLSLPLLNRNRGNIAIEQATRTRLRDEFQNRLNQAWNDVERILAEQALLEQQKRQVDAGLQALERASHQAKTALHEGNIDYLAYASLHGALLAQQLEAISIEQSLLEQRVALQALAGSTLPTERQH